MAKAAKKKAVKKKAVKKTARRRATLKKAAKKRIAGYSKTEGGNVLLPDKAVKPVPPSKLKKGMKAAKVKLTDFMAEFSDIKTEGFNVKTMEFTAGFDAKGEFLGFGVGGSTTVKIVVEPD